MNITISWLLYFPSHWNITGAAKLLDRGVMSRSYWRQIQQTIATTKLPLWCVCQMIILVMHKPIIIKKRIGQITKQMRIFWWEESTGNLIDTLLQFRILFIVLTRIVSEQVTKFYWSKEMERLSVMEILQKGNHFASQILTKTENGVVY